MHVCLQEGIPQHSPLSFQLPGGSSGCQRWRHPFAKARPLNQFKTGERPTGEHDENVNQVCRTLLAVAAIVLAHIPSTDTVPLMPSGTDPHAPYILGFHE